MREYVRRWLCRIGWDQACRNTPQEAQESLERQQILSWRLRAAVRDVVEVRRDAFHT